MFAKSETRACEDYRLTVCSFGSLSESDQARCIDILTRGAAVDPNSAQQELPRARLLVIVRKGTEIVGLGAIKRVRIRYASDKAAKSKYPFDTATPELGYISVAREHQGHHLSKLIVSGLLSKHSGPLFATTDCEKMKNTLRRFGFTQKGQEWKGKRGQLSLWLNAAADVERTHD